MRGFDAVVLSITGTTVPVVCLITGGADLLSEYFLGLGALAVIAVVGVAVGALLVCCLHTIAVLVLITGRAHFRGNFHTLAPLVLEAVRANFLCHLHTLVVLVLEALWAHLFGEFVLGKQALVVVLRVIETVGAYLACGLNALAPLVVETIGAHLVRGLDANTVLVLEIMRAHLVRRLFYALAVLLFVPMLAFAVAKIVVALAARDPMRVGRAVVIVAALRNASAMLLHITEVAFAVVKIVVTLAVREPAGVGRAAVRALRRTPHRTSVRGFHGGGDQ